ncbi:hypothetical protein CKAN_02439500 [Cinnamomum micranthum f. kanehirae]|uniref:Histidine phosphatase superfamily n=1 Tax=Cinnamomum micranthum f. kanehirae TaxID=337451 RepID=A0A3S3NMJ6_9MAGN|nr:hypothetical protein CKAN_02439500 [Cinnamomum micranthum f. kanehirae]
MRAAILCNCTNNTAISPLLFSKRSIFSSSSSLKTLRNPNITHFSSRSLVVETVESELSENAEKKSRRLILLRHAESSGDPYLRDHDRPLSKAGRIDAVNISHQLQQMGWMPELILSRVQNLSDAARTKETLRIMQEHVPGFLEAEVHFVASFYSIAAMDGQTAEHLQRTICEYSRDEIFTVMCMGHNRGWEEAASMLSGAAIELKTCNAALLEATGKSWDEAFSSVGLGGWKLHGIVKPSTAS